MTDETPAPAAEKAAPAPDAATSPESPMIPKARLDEEIGKRKAAESELASLAEALLGEVPEKLKPLIPEGLSAAQQVAWYQKAKATGVFANGTAKVPETDQSKPATTPRDRDLSSLPVHARMAASYGTSK